MVAMKGVLLHTTPLFMAAVRLVPAGILLVAISGFAGRPQPKGWRAWGWISLFALVDAALFQGFLAVGLVRTGAGVGSVMIDSQPLVVALLALWLFGERIGLWGWLGLGLGILGISLIGLPDQWVLNLFQVNSLPQDFAHSIEIAPELLRQFLSSGEFWMLMAAVAMAVGTVMIRAVAHHADPVVATGWHMLLGGLPLLGLSQIWESHQWRQLSGLDWLAMGYATIFGSAVAYGLFFYFASQRNLTSLSALTFLTPIFALIFGNILLAEILTPLQSIGVCLTLVAIYLVNQRQQLAAIFPAKDAHPARFNTTKELEQVASLYEQPLEVPIQVEESESEIA